MKKLSLSLIQTMRWQCRISSKVYEQSSTAASGIINKGEGWYPNFRHTKYIHIPLVMFPPSSSSHALVPPALSYSKPFQWKGD
jgi:hypothetical protein